MSTATRGSAETSKMMQKQSPRKNGGEEGDPFVLPLGGKRVRPKKKLGVGEGERGRIINLALSRNFKKIAVLTLKLERARIERFKSQNFKSRPNLTILPVVPIWQCQQRLDRLVIRHISGNFKHFFCTHSTSIDRVNTSFVTQRRFSFDFVFRVYPSSFQRREEEIIKMSLAAPSFPFSSANLDGKIYSFLKKVSSQEREKRYRREMSPSFYRNISPLLTPPRPSLPFSQRKRRETQ